MSLAVLSGERRFRPFEAHPNAVLHRLVVRANKIRHCRMSIPSIEEFDRTIAAQGNTHTYHRFVLGCHSPCNENVHGRL
jgi:hypothetical protein